MENPKTVDASLWWDSFVPLFEDLDAAPLSDRLVKEIEANHAWFLGSVNGFKPPSEESRLALDSPLISVGSHRLHVTPELKEAALRVSASLCLNEVQSCILVNRSFEFKKSVTDVQGQEFLHLILIQYYFERQCLLKCIRRIFVHALSMNDGSSTDGIHSEALMLIRDGLGRKLLSILQALFSSVSSDKTEVDIAILWVEETIIEGNLIMDILFLVFYDNFCSCSVEEWKILSSIFKGILSGFPNAGKLAASVEARNSFDHAKAQLLLILIETLDLESLLQMVHGEVPFREGSSVFSLSDIEEIDAIVSGFSIMGTVEAGPLVLAWAIFVCLLLSLPESDYGVLMEIDHSGYVRQAIEVASFNYLLDILHSDSFRNSDGPVSGFLSVLRTLISAFIASYDLTNQTDDTTLNMMLDVICQVYHGEESLSMQFWDRDSFVDGPIRSLLYMLEREYPFQIVALVRLLSCLCEGTWAAECVYNFLDKMNGVTLLFEIPDGSGMINDIIETHNPVYIPGAEGFIIPNGTHGHVLKLIRPNMALVHWEFRHSGVFLLLLSLAQKHHPENYEEVHLTLNLLYRMISSNTALCFPLLFIHKSSHIQAAQSSGHLEKNVRVDVVRIICSLVSNLVQDVRNAGTVSICINILAELFKCAPSHVNGVASESNFSKMEVASSSGTWLLTGGLSRMLLASHMESAEYFSLTTSVLDFTAQLVEKGAEDDMVSALIVFSLQYVLNNHMNWKHKSKHASWTFTQKVLKVMRSCINVIKFSKNIGCKILDLLLHDSSIHSMLCRIISVSAQTLKISHVTRHFELKEMEALQLALCSSLNIVYSFLAVLPTGVISNAPAFARTVLSSAVITAAISSISSENSALQVAAAKVLSMLCFIVSQIQPLSAEKVSLVTDSMQIWELATVTYAILDKEENGHKDLLVPIFNLLTSAARFQPALLVCILLAEEDAETPMENAGYMKYQLLNLKKAILIESIMKYLARSEVIIMSAPDLLFSILDLLKALWEGGIQYMQILERIRSSGMFWKKLTSILATEVETDTSVKNLVNNESECTAYRYQCQGKVLEIMERELFLQKKLLQDEISEKKTAAFSKEKGENILSSEMSKTSNIASHFKDMLSIWGESSTMDKLIRSFSSNGYNNVAIHQAKIYVSLCIVHLIAKLLTCDAGSLSISLIKNIHNISNKLYEHPAFSALLAQYSLRGYSDSKDLTGLVLNDLYYHLQGELEGREIISGHFQELSQFLLDLEIFQCKENNYKKDDWPPTNDVHIFDIPHLRAEFGIEYWDYTEFRPSKEILEKMFLHMHDANLSVSLTYSKHFALEALIGLIALYDENILEVKSLGCGEMSETLIESSIQYLCKEMQITGNSLISTLKPPEDLLEFVTTQGKLLLVLSRIFFTRQLQKKNTRKFLPLSLLLIKTSSLILKFLTDIRPLTDVLNKTVKLLLMLLLVSVEFSYPMANVTSKSNVGINHLGDSSSVMVGFLPVICKYTEHKQVEIINLSITLLDLMLKGFLTPSTWLPVFQQHLQFQLILQNIQEKESPVSLSVLNFCLTLSQVKAGAGMLHSSNIFSSLKLLFGLMNDNISSILCKDEKLGQQLGLGLAIITSMIYSLGDDFSSSDIVENVISYLFSEKFHLMSYLSAPTFRSVDQSKKRARAEKSQTSLTTLRLTEQTLMLICALSRHQSSWTMGIKKMDSELRERSIHLLAFIGKGSQKIGDSSNRSSPPFCPPVLQEEINLNGRASSFNCRHGWFGPSPFGHLSSSKISASTDTGSTVVIKDQPNGNPNSTQFSVTVAVQIYRIAFLALKFLCMQAKAAAKRAEETEFIDLAHFPELPMPEILHGLQDQTISIVTEVCNINGTKPIQPETEAICCLLLQVLEKALYLELCVSWSCGIRPVLGRIEDFSKEIKQLMQAVEQHDGFKTSMRSLREIIALVYPGLLQANGLI